VEIDTENPRARAFIEERNKMHLAKFDKMN
jgi:hypothetical protein